MNEEKQEAALAEEQGFVRVPPECQGLYGNTYVYRSGDKTFSTWRGDITSTAGQISYPIYVKREHVQHLRTDRHHAPAALVHAHECGLHT